MDNLEILAAYRFVRDMEYPGVPVRQFTDWKTHKEWMRQQRTKYQRMINNYIILEECLEMEKTNEK